MYIGLYLNYLILNIYTILAYIICLIKTSYIMGQYYCLYSHSICKQRLYSAERHKEILNKIYFLSNKQLAETNFPIAIAYVKYSSSENCLECSVDKEFLGNLKQE